MPQVFEAARARLHWDKGQLAGRLDGAKPTALLHDMIEVIHAEDGALMRYQMAENRKKGNA